MQEKQTTTFVRDVMTLNVECAHLHESLSVAAERMRSRDAHALPVLDGDKIVGMVTSSDIVHRAASLGHDIRETSVQDVVSRKIVSCQANHTLREAAAIMEGAHVRHLPVLDDDDGLVGMLSLEDLARHGLELEVSGRVLRSTGSGTKEDDSTHAPKSYSTKPTLKD